MEATLSATAIAVLSGVVVVVVVVSDGGSVGFILSLVDMESVVVVLVLASVAVAPLPNQEEAPTAAPEKKDAAVLAAPSTTAYTSFSMSCSIVLISSSVNGTGCVLVVDAVSLSTTGSAVAVASSLLLFTGDVAAAREDVTPPKPQLLNEEVTSQTLLLDASSSCVLVSSATAMSLSLVSLVMALSLSLSLALSVCCVCTWYAL
mmetsp:Transcript_19015/g.27907  ORF Transcript_19015/g.27907 Transcript_19015/m.27907 type:complete len:204 (-) Transcript_19015:11-622(-)